MDNKKIDRWKVIKSKIRITSSLFTSNDQNQKYGEMLNKYSFLFTIISYINFCKDIAMWVYSEIGNFSLPYYIAVIVILIGIFSIYILVILAKLKNNKLISLFSFIYFLGIETLSLVINFLPFLFISLGGIIFISLVAYYAFSIKIVKFPKIKKTDKTLTKILTVLLPILILGLSITSLIFLPHIIFLLTVFTIGASFCVFAIYKLSLALKNKMHEQIENRKKLIVNSIFLISFLGCAILYFVMHMTLIILSII